MEDPLMLPSIGITEPKISAEPLGTEGELTAGPDNINPHNSVEEKEMVETIEQKQQDEDLYQTVPATLEFDVPNPTQDNDPFLFDDIDTEDTQEIQLPFAEGFDPSGFRL
jgi:hypothetical protein